MTRHITSLGVHRTALIGATIGAAFALVVAALFLMSVFVPRPREAPRGMGMFGSGMILILPVVYFVVGYVSTAIGVVLFNLIAPRLGGIPITFADDEPPAAL